MQTWWILVFGLAAAAFAILVKELRALGLPKISDAEFLRRLGVSEGPQAELYLNERNRIARVLSLPKNRLDPDHELQTLNKTFDVFGSFSMAWNDLEDELREQATENCESPGDWGTIGDLVKACVDGRSGSTPKI